MGVTRKALVRLEIGRKVAFFGKFGTRDNSFCGKSVRGDDDSWGVCRFIVTLVSSAMGREGYSVVVGAGARRNGGAPARGSFGGLHPPYRFRWALAFRARIWSSIAVKRYSISE
jgi:hypothetical protein